MVGIFFILIKMNIAALVVAAIVLSIKKMLHFLGISNKSLLWLWTLIAFRLVVPKFPSSRISAFNLVSDNTDSVISLNVHSGGTETLYENVFFLDVMKIAAMIWVIGAVIMLVTAVISWVMLKKHLRFSICDIHGIYWTENISSPFVFGIFKPRIYFPEYMKNQDYTFALEHEKVHIRRKDYIIKMVAYIILSVNWFNPINWLLFRLFSYDVEVVCDEEVLNEKGIEIKEEYIKIILSSVRCGHGIFKHYVGLSFNQIPKRIKNILRYNKSRRVITPAVIGIYLLMFFVFGTNSVEKTMQIQYLNNQNAAENEETDLYTPEYAARTDESIIDAAEDSSAKNNSQKSDYGSSHVKNGKKADDSYKNAPVTEKNIQENKEENNTADAESKTLKNSIKIKDKKEYSYKSELKGESKDIACDENGEIKLSFEVNAENLTSVKFKDTITGENVGGFKILAKNNQEYEFDGFEPGKSYDVEVCGETGSSWMIEGSYTIY